MAVTHRFQMSAHPSIYEYAERELKVSFSYPEHGTNEQTGILMLIPNYGQTSDSSMFLEARGRIADDMNMITIQCDYFGLEFMQGIQNPVLEIGVDELSRTLSKNHFDYVNQDNSINLNRLLEVGRHYPFHLRGKEVLNETKSNFNDMGLMQAVDLVSAVLGVMAILKDNQFAFNHEKIVISGAGHGAYLAYVCNAVAPRLFHQLIDYSGYLVSPYLAQPRYLSSTIGQMRLDVEFSYLVNQIDVDLELLRLPNLYRKFQNYCNIVSCQSVQQSSESNFSKAQFSNSILLSMQYEPASHIEETYKQDSTKLIDYVLHNFKAEKINKSGVVLSSHSIVTPGYHYNFDCSSGMIIASRVKNVTSSNN
ncbi:hypothetical protein ASG89_29070 [Paenibacillus sp. Soil766]|uniref:DUF2920 family protein n=1 Tax=Paenibacillus sp. Soil766 TaxID=1736404 RepID=UPI00070A08D1|nr:DUF2920 family protein [Paenibacillus sp. Soil766]KRE97957.1 hypothetical protein ASG89_29070 [Paenibacillus sp. Soil766]